MFSIPYMSHKGAGSMDDYITINEAAKKWNVTPRAIRYHVQAGRVDGAVKKGDLWLIPASAPKPEDGRKNNRRQPKKEDTQYE